MTGPGVLSIVLLLSVNGQRAAWAETSDPTSASAPATSSSAPAKGVTVGDAPASSLSDSENPKLAPGPGGASIIESYLSIRDPFRKPDSMMAKEEVKSELERFPADSFKFVGILTGPKKLRAMLMDPNGKTHFVADKARVGTRGGVIASISQDKIRVREKTINLLGQEESAYIELKLPSDTKIEAKDINGLLDSQKADAIKGAMQGMDSQKVEALKAMMQGGAGMPKPDSRSDGKVDTQKVMMQALDPQMVQKLMQGAGQK
jgi:hypothetical protein